MPKAIAEITSGGRRRPSASHKRQARRRDGDRNAQRHEARVVVHVRAGVQRRHADVVHGGDAAAEKHRRRLRGAHW